MGTLDNRVAVITGGNSGIGPAMAKLFAAEGATVVISGHDIIRPTRRRCSAIARATAS